MGDEVWKRLWEGFALLHAGAGVRDGQAQDALGAAHRLGGQGDRRVLPGPFQGAFCGVGGGGGEVQPA